MSDLESDFKETAEKINAKIKEAAAALAEANELASKAGLPALIYTQFIDDDSRDDEFEAQLDKLSEDENWDGDERSPLERKMSLIDVSDLESEIENGGWQTSSAYC